ncbi:Parvalbumin [Parasponia andersonii]|uniref:Parvalbumin n=1 Tax=Parasponia andersonii TaxID=3476 RepID=A0A2P5ADG4_PARAD|nr:Parvalbumin [Parasponia andersonii]
MAGQILKKLGSIIVLYGVRETRKRLKNPTKRPKTKLEKPSIESPRVNYCDEPPSEEELRRAFDRFNTNKDGKISREEFKSAVRIFGPEVSDCDTAEAFRGLDSDGDGFIDFQEFLRMFDMVPTGGPATTETTSGKGSRIELFGYNDMIGRMLFEVVNKLNNEGG